MRINLVVIVVSMLFVLAYVVLKTPKHSNLEAFPRDKTPNIFVRTEPLQNQGGKVAGAMCLVPFEMDDNISPKKYSTEMRFADSNKVISVLFFLMEHDPSMTNDLQRFLDSPDEVSVEDFLLLSNIASNILELNQDHRPRVPLGQRKETSQAELDQAEQVFEAYLQEREAKYEKIEPTEGMISVSRAVEIAKSHNKMEYDKSQKLKHCHPIAFK